MVFRHFRISDSVRDSQESLLSLVFLCTTEESSIHNGVRGNLERFGAFEGCTCSGSFSRLLHGCPADHGEILYLQATRACCGALSLGCSPLGHGGGAPTHAAAADIVAVA